MKRCSAIISHEENANQNQNELPLHTSGMAIEKKKPKTSTKNNKCSRGCGENGTIYVAGENIYGKLVWLPW